MKKKFPRLSDYLDSIVDKTSQIDPIYVHNFRGLIRIIPFVGDLIDANTARAIHKWKREVHK